MPYTRSLMQGTATHEWTTVVYMT